MARDGQALRNKVLAKLLPPNSASLEGILLELGVSVDTLERLWAESLTKPTPSEFGQRRPTSTAGTRPRSSAFQKARVETLMSLVRSLVWT